ncbi:hypothetical protein KIM372_16580 [Bombiscardovia nodaiensis]|uniref:PASTA domain-containing protein n=1 Tax=Bombiscardovia nodaiensis TaxID=2932181 RepID=A0ABN6SFR9_9BIFI|nr:hypothetical protein KIM372_16580 [Bombiscardovia nodaiensis]
MKYCTRCGSANPDESTFCDQCGHTLESAPRTTPATTPAVTTAPTTGGQVTTKTSSSKRIYIALAALLVVALCVVGGFFAYRAYGPTTVPKLQAQTAEEAVQKLKAAGIPAQTRLEFSPKRKGSFISLANVQAGDRLNDNQRVTVLESAGPGVPKGTVGATQAAAEEKLKMMGVPLTVSQVVTQKPEGKGKVVASFPADGQAVSDAKSGIHLGVGVDKQGIPVEIAGMDKDQAEKALKDKGYDVLLEARFSSSQNLNKIVGSDPAIGQPYSNKRVTLYYGVGAKDKLDVVTSYDASSGSLISFADRADHIAGHYCTDSGKCIDLDHVAGKFKAEYGDLKVRGEKVDSDQPFSLLSFCHYAQYNACAPEGIHGAQGDSEPMKYHLIAGETGAMELYAGGGLPYCGTSLFPGSMQACDHGKIAEFSRLRDDPSFKNTGLNWKADEFFLVMPVGANLDKLKANGYFEGQSTYKPDPDRPYLIRRDSSKYQEEPVNDTNQFNPFAPTEYSKPSQPFKQAPNKDNVYYLVESPIDWLALEAHQASSNKK